MSIKTQKILRFIPIINIITYYYWLRLCFKKPVRMKTFLADLLRIFLGILIITIIRIVISRILKSETIDLIVTNISIYFYLLVIAWFSVRAQEKILEKERK